MAEKKTPSLNDLADLRRLKQEAEARQKWDDLHKGMSLDDLQAEMKGAHERRYEKGGAQRLASIMCAIQEKTHAEATQKI